MMGILTRLFRSRGNNSTSQVFNVEDNIKVKTGAFKDFTGIIKEIDLKKKKLHVAITGLPVSEALVEFDYSQVEKV